MTKPNEAQKRFMRTMVGGKSNPTRLGKLQPRDRPVPPIGYTRTGPLCVACGNPRESRRGLKCDECSAGTR